MRHPTPFDGLRFISACLLFCTGCLWQLGCGTPNKTKPSTATTQQADGGKIMVVTAAWPNGQVKLRKHILVEPDGSSLDHGLCTKWHANGKKSYEATFVRGKAEGTVTRWHDNGEIWMVQNYRNGLKQGVCTSYDEKGRKRKEECYDNDQPHGTWMIWKGDGQLKWKASFSHGVPLADSGKTPQEL